MVASIDTGVLGDEINSLNCSTGESESVVPSSAELARRARIRRKTQKMPELWTSSGTPHISAERMLERREHAFSRDAHDRSHAGKGPFREDRESLPFQNERDEASRPMPDSVSQEGPRHNLGSGVSFD